jgi:hypothetical protein
LRNDYQSRLKRWRQRHMHACFLTLIANVGLCKSTHRAREEEVVWARCLRLHFEVFVFCVDCSQMIQFAGNTQPPAVRESVPNGGRQITAAVQCDECLNVFKCISLRDVQSSLWHRKQSPKTALPLTSTRRRAIKFTLLDINFPLRRVPGRSV